MAHTDVSIGLNLGGDYAPQPVYAAPEPVYYNQSPVYGPNVVYRDDDRWHEDHDWHGRDYRR